MKPDRSNYEIWFTDLLDGNLSEKQVEELKVFLKENPDLNEELNGLNYVTLNPPDLVFSGKSTLGRLSDDLSESEFDHLCIASLENDITPEQKAELYEIIGLDEMKRKSFELIHKLRLKPMAVRFAGKKGIRKLTTGQKVFRLTVAALSAAAAILVLIVVFLSSPSGRIINEQQALSVTSPDSLTILVNPSIVVKNNELSSLQKMSVNRQLKSSPEEIKAPDQQILAAVQDIESKPDSAFMIRRVKAVETITIGIHGNLVNAGLPDPYGLLAYNKYATIPSPFEEDRSNVDRFFARMFHEKIMKDKTAGARPVKTYDIALAGISGLNRLFGWQIALHKNTDENGDVKSYNFNSKLLKFNTPEKKASTSL